MSPRFLRMSYIVAILAGVGFFVMSVLLLGVWPGQTLARQIGDTSPAHPLGLTASEQRGRAIYARDGCAYCHTQQIRYLTDDVSRFGAATLAWETIFDYPHLWGTRRIGPDLSRETSVRSEDWQFTHLYAPRSVVPDSVMPAFSSMFDGAPDRPRQEARDLVAYLETLGRARALAAPDGETNARHGNGVPEDERELAFSALNANPATPRRTGDVPAIPESSDLEQGRRVYASNCAGCHGKSGEGDGPAAAGLHPKPTSFTVQTYSRARLNFALWNGVAGSAMPAWRDLPLRDLSAVEQVIRGFGQPQENPSLPPDIQELGARIYREHCAQCHGDQGAGDGWSAAQFPMAPTNFTQQRPSLAQSIRTVRNGVEGSPMAPWSDKLTDAEVTAVASYVRGFFQP